MLGSRPKNLGLSGCSSLDSAVLRPLFTKHFAEDFQSLPGEAAQSTKSARRHKARSHRVSLRMPGVVSILPLLVLQTALCGRSTVTSVETTSRMEPQEKRNPACACIEQTSSTTGLSDSTVRYLGCWRRSRFATAHLQADRSIIRFLHGCNAARCTPWDAKLH